MTTQPAVIERTSARERLLAAATELFYEEGINTVGIDRVIERAGVAKASLYNAFGSKDELIKAYLEAQYDAHRARLTTFLAQQPTPQAKILAVFDCMRESAAKNGFRGCAFVRANAELGNEHAIKTVCSESRQWLRTLLQDLATEAGARDPIGLAQQLVILHDGAAVSGRMDGAGAALAAKAVAACLLTASGVATA